MAEADPVLRMKNAAQRAIEGSSVAALQRAHYEELSREFGLDPKSVQQRELAARKRARVGPLRWMRGTLILTIIIFGALNIADLWNSGAYAGLVRSKPVAAQTRARPWITPGSRDDTMARTSVPEAETSEPPNFIEPLETKAAGPSASLSANQPDAQPPQDGNQ